MKQGLPKGHNILVENVIFLIANKQIHLNDYWYSEHSEPGARALKGIVKTGCFTEPSQEMVRHITSIKAQIFILRFGDCTV